MGSACDTIEETIDYLVTKGEKIGLIKVRLYRPFSIEHLLKAIPATAKKISVLDRTKEPGSIGEPLYLDIIAALRDTAFENVPVYGGRYGLGSKDTTPSQIIAVYRNMQTATPKKHFTIGIEDDVTNLSLSINETPDTTPIGTHSCKFWGLGADGTVGANKNSIKIIGDHTNLYAQGYFAYDSKKSGGVTISHLRFGSNPIKSTYYVAKADFVACHNPSYIDKYEMVEELKEGGIFLLNCQWNDEELKHFIPAKVKRFIAANNIKFYTIDGMAIAKELGLGGRINTILQSAFFSLSKIIPVEDAVKFMKDAATASYGKKGEKIVAMNHAAIDKGITGAKAVTVPADWANATDEIVAINVEGDRKDLVDFVENILIPVNGMQGDKLPVSTFKDMADGTFPQGSAAYEKRGIAVDVPEWQPENCIQCNFCSYVCPHAVIRPFALTVQEAANAPAGMQTKDMTGMPGYKFSITPSVLDCTGCGSCANVCPGMKGNKALIMKPLDSQLERQAQFTYAHKLEAKPEVLLKFKPESVKGSQFKTPLFEFSGACAGCGETPYAKLATQLFGDRMLISNATGCSSIWGGSAPSTPYTVNSKGQGPSWANSLFEDNAEHGLGMYLAITHRRDKLTNTITKLAACELPTEWGLNAACNEWLAGKDDATASITASEKLRAALKIADKECGNCGCECDALYKEIISSDDLLVKKSVWILGGDGWAYDIGFGGLDHVIALGMDVNILVFDTEVYSNTGGQASKATPAGSVAQFAASGKSTKKKDLAAIAMTYGYVYVAQIAMGADYNQTIKAFNEAESYKGPSIIIAYAPCINHGIKGGMGVSQTEEKLAVQAGYWHNFRFDPRLADEGKNPFVLDSKEPTASYDDFIKSEVRYNSLQRLFPERATDLFAQAGKQAKDKYANLVKLAKQYE
jgi:pyruvate-ferredoxin/flavodoxin oxidoreductase